MRLPFAQPVPYPDSRRPWVPSDHNTRWRLLKINHNFMIKSKNPSQHTTPPKTLPNTQHLTQKARQEPTLSPDDIASALAPPVTGWRLHSGKPYLFGLIFDCFIVFLLLVFNFSSYFYCFSMHFNFASKPNSRLGGELQSAS